MGFARNAILNKHQPTTRAHTVHVLVGYQLILSANVTLPNLTFTIDGVAYDGPLSVILSPGIHTITVQTQALIRCNSLYSAHDCFVGWSGSSTQTSATITINLTTNISLTACYFAEFAVKVVPN